MSWIQRWILWLFVARQNSANVYNIEFTLKQPVKTYNVKTWKQHSYLQKVIKPRLPSDLPICPVHTLVAYLKGTKSVRRSPFVFISTKDPYDQVELWNVFEVCRPVAHSNNVGTQEKKTTKKPRKLCFEQSLDWPASSHQQPVSLAPIFFYFIFNIKSFCLAGHL